VIDHRFVLAAERAGAAELELSTDVAPDRLHAHTRRRRA
jgi:hypothetical protein